MRELPDAIFMECMECGEVTEHEILKGKAGRSRLEATLRCSECKHVVTTTVPIPRIIPAKVVISEGSRSETSSIDLESDDLLAAGDEFFLDDGRRVRITALESKDGRRPEKAQATDVSVIWAILFDIVNIKVSINDVHKTYARYTEAEPDDEFIVGQMLSFGDMDCLVHSIKTKERLLRRGSAEARDIVRIYGKLRKRSYPVLESEDDAEDI